VEDGDCVDIALPLKDGPVGFNSMPVAIVSQDTSQVTFEVSHHKWNDGKRCKGRSSLIWFFTRIALESSISY
jgi:hypothetical protein